MDNDDNTHQSDDETGYNSSSSGNDRGGSPSAVNDDGQVMAQATADEIADNATQQSDNGATQHTDNGATQQAGTDTQDTATQDNATQRSDNGGNKQEQGQGASTLELQARLSARILRENEKMAAMSAHRDSEIKLQERLAREGAAALATMSSHCDVTATNHYHGHSLSRRTQGLKQHNQQQGTAGTRLPSRTNSNSSRRTNVSLNDDDDNELDEAECQDTLMMIAKAQAALGEEFVEDLESGGDQSDGKQRIPRRLRANTDSGPDLVRPGAYSKAPGEDFQRNATFERATYAPLHGTATPLLKKPPPIVSYASSAPASLVGKKQPGKYKQQSATTNKRKPRANASSLDSDDDDDADLIRHLMASPPSAPRNNAKEQDDDDRKPAAKMTRTIPKLRRDSLASAGSYHSRTSDDDCFTPTQRRRRPRRFQMKRVESIGTSDDDHDTSEEFSPFRSGRRRMRRPPARAETMTDETDDDEDYLSGGDAFASPHTMADHRRRQRTRRSSKSQTSIRLSMLARSFRRGSNDAQNSSGGIVSGLSASGITTSSGTGTVSSDKRIADLTEQSVSHFVKSFRTASMDALPIAATVVPSEEDLESLIRSRLEDELRTHLNRELNEFRQRLFQEIIQRGQLQVAEQLQMVDSVDGLSLNMHHHPLHGSSHHNYNSGDDTPQNHHSQSGGLERNSITIASLAAAAGGAADGSTGSAVLSLMPTATTTLVDPFSMRTTDGLVVVDGVHEENVSNNNHSYDGGVTDPEDRYEDEPGVVVWERTRSRSPRNHESSLNLTALENSRGPRGLSDDFTRSIRQSLNIEFGHLGDELGVEAAQVIDIEASHPTITTPTVTTGLSSSQADSFRLANNHGSSSRNGSGRNVSCSDIGSKRSYRSDNKSTSSLRERRFVLTSRGLLGSLFLVFVLGAFVGAGTAILAMWPVGDE